MPKLVPIFMENDQMGWVMAGPTCNLPDTHKLIKCAKEISTPANRVAYDLGTPDFTPFDDDTVLAHLPDIMDDIANGVPLYIGCMGGIGRTGTLLAILAAQHPALDYEDAIQYVRAAYIPHAVETAQQRDQVERLAHFERGDIDPELTALEMQGYYLDEVWDAPAPFWKRWWRAITNFG